MEKLSKYGGSQRRNSRWGEINALAQSQEHGHARTIESVAQALKMLALDERRVGRKNSCKSFFHRLD